MTTRGKGFFIWVVRNCEAGDVNAIARVAAQAGLSHVLVKIADGTQAYNVDTSSGYDYVPPLINALRAWKIRVYGWHYVYGYEPIKEADIAIQRIQQLGLDGYVVDAEAQYKLPGRDVVARQFMSRLRAVLPNYPIGLSSYRYPTYHPSFPFQAFLEYCDFNMPQVYWINAHNPADQLVRSVREFQAITPFRPIVPTGAAFVQGDWAPSVTEVNDFLRAAQNLNLTGANFWEWSRCRKDLPQVWEAIKAYPWPVDTTNQDIVHLYIAALNTRNPEKVLELYNSNAVHVTSKRTVQGIQALRDWYQTLFNQTLPAAFFLLVDFSGDLGTRHFRWTATSSAGKVNNGNDSFGLVNGKITYHYTSFTVSP